jgi:pyruvate carboxylase subunit B
MENRWPRQLNGFIFGQGMALKYQVTIGQRRFEITIDGDEPFAFIDGRGVRVDYRRLRGGKLHSILADNINYEFEMERANEGFDIWLGSASLHADVSDEKTDRMRRLMGGAATASKASSLKAPMPGLIIKVEVSPGQHVKKGDGLVIVEAMKMENELKAHAPGIIKEIKIKPGDAVEKGQVLLVFE